MASTFDTKGQNGSPLTNGHLHDVDQDHTTDFGKAQTREDVAVSTQNAAETLEGSVSSLWTELSLLYSPAIEAKIWAVASKALAMVSMRNFYRKSIITDIDYRRSLLLCFQSTLEPTARHMSTAILNFGPRVSSQARCTNCCTGLASSQLNLLLRLKVYLTC